MPLNTKKTKAALKENISTEIKASKPLKQAVAIAYSVRNRKSSPSKTSAKKNFRKRY